MRKLFLVIFTICLFITPILADGPYNGYENESNDIPALADIIPQGSYSVLCNGVINPAGNDDWYTYSVNIGNPIVVTIVSAANPATLNVDVCTDNPGVVQFTLNLLTMPSNSFIAANGNMHFIRVYSATDNNNYQVLIENLQDPTLPVVLSSFSGTFSSDFVGIQWTTQSETELSGYNILRNESSNLENALQVNQGIIPSTNTSTVQDYNYRDQEIEPNTTYYYWLESVNMDGTSEYHGPVTVNTNDIGSTTTPEIVEFTGMEPAYPNPFGNETNLKFRLNSDMNARLEIYNVKGEKIRTIFAGELTKGTHIYKWDGKNSLGATVSSGLYMGRLVTPSGLFNSKMYLFK